MRILLLLLAALALGGCSSPGPTQPASRDADAVFERLADEFIGGYLAFRPQEGASLGLHQYDGKVGDLSRPGIADELARLKSFDQQLAELNPAGLSPRNSRDYRLLRGAIQHEIMEFEDIRGYSRNPMTYAGVLDVNLYLKRDFAPLPNRVQSIIAILNQAPRIMAAAHSNLDEALPRPFIETAIEVASGSADFLTTDLPEALRGLNDAKLKTDVDAAARLAVSELRSYTNWLVGQKLPKATDDFALGTGKYLRLLQTGEMLSTTPDNLLLLSAEELKRCDQLFQETAKIIDPAKPAVEVFKDIQKEHPSEQSLIPDVRRDLDSIRQFVIDHHLVSIPAGGRLAVTVTPQYLRATSFASMDAPGPFETKATEAWYYVTPVESNWPAARKEDWLEAFDYYTSDIVSIHEAYPGHYVQFLHLNASPATPLEKIFSSYAFVEGWAHYCEQMMVDEGFGATPGSTNREQAVRTAKFRLAQIDEAMLRLCRLQVSVRMHCQGMTVEEGARFFENHCHLGAGPSHDEATRGTFDPEYLYYSLGKMEFLKLREDYRKQEGANFNLQKFHDEVLAHGMPPVRLLREVLLKDPVSWAKVL